MTNSDPTEKGDAKENTDEETLPSKEENTTKTEESKEEPASPDPYYPPIIYLPEVEVNSGEDGEVEMFKRRARLYRYAHECSPPEWKERGTGDVKIMKDTENVSARIVMRREKTLKVCANHSILPWMEMKPNCGSEKAWVWKTQADYADEEPKQETLAIRFGTVDNSKKFEAAFIEARMYVLEQEAKSFNEKEGQELKTEKEDAKTEEVNGDKEATDNGDMKASKVNEKETLVTNDEKNLSNKLGSLEV